MYCIGLTGTIASGKSTVAACFEKLGINVISADVIAKKLTAVNQPTLHLIQQHFGQSVLTSNGELNRRLLREIIFNHQAERIWLENLLHPLIRKQIEAEIKQAKAPYCVIEIPLLKQKSDYPYLNRILLVLAQPEIQIARLIARDQSTRKQALAILALQPEELQYKALADDIVTNDATVASLEKKIILLHQDYAQGSLASQ